MTRTICELANGVWTGRSETRTEKQGTPPGWVDAEPPTVTAPWKRARWISSGWEEINWPVVVPLDQRKARMLDELAEIKWQRELAGPLFNGVRVEASDRAKTLVLGVRTRAKENANTARRWKIAPGQYVMLDAAALIALGDAIDAHVTACFDREAALADVIVAATSHAQLDAVNLNSGWPD